MFASLTALVIRLAAIRWAIKSFVGLGLLVPVALALKAVGLPILAVLGVLAMPVLFVLFLFGLPIFLVLIAGGVLLGGLFFLLTLGIFALKIFVFVVLPIWLVWMLVGFLWRLARPSPRDSVPAGFSGPEVS